MKYIGNNCIFCPWNQFHEKQQKLYGSVRDELTWHWTGWLKLLKALLIAVEAFFKVAFFLIDNRPRSKTKPPDSWVNVVKWVLGSWICGLRLESIPDAVSTLSLVKPKILEFILLLASPLNPTLTGAARCRVMSCSDNMVMLYREKEKVIKIALCTIFTILLTL